MLRLICALLLLVLSAQGIAATPGKIATLCKQQWPGAKGLQSFCIKEKRNYQEWLQYTRKRVYANPAQRDRIDRCIADHQPDYRQAYDCVYDPGLFQIELF